MRVAAYGRVMAWTDRARKAVIVTEEARPGMRRRGRCAKASASQVPGAFDHPIALRIMGAQFLAREGIEVVLPEIGFAEFREVLAFVGERVGAVGAAADVLHGVVASRGERLLVGGAQGRVYITNVLKCRPPGNRNPQPDEVAQCSPFLQRQIELVRPKVLLAMGRFGAQALLASQHPDLQGVPLGKLRGQPHRHATTPVVVSYHPAYLLRTPADKAKAWADWCLALSLAQGA